MRAFRSGFGRAGAACHRLEKDDSGNPSWIQDWDGTRSYTYDANNRLITGGGTSYGYDWVGNRLNPPASPNPMTYDATDKLLLWPGQLSFSYYPTGSLYQQKSPDGTIVAKTWEYTGAELVSSVDHRDVAYDSEMEWDGDSNRVSFTSSTTGTDWQFVYDTTAGIPAVVEEVTPSDGSFYYVREPGGHLIARVEGSTGTPPVLYYHFDELGSTRLVTNSSGTVTDTYTYDAWGKQTAHTGSTAQPYRFVGQLGYYSHYQDSNLFSQSGYQFLQLGVRSYDALTGRFTQRDPAKHEISLYEYANNSPVRRVDPRGLKADDNDPCNPDGYNPNSELCNGKLYKKCKKGCNKYFWKLCWGTWGKCMEVCRYKMEACQIFAIDKADTSEAEFVTVRRLLCCWAIADKFKDLPEPDAIKKITEACKDVE